MVRTLDLPSMEDDAIAALQTPPDWRDTVRNHPDVDWRPSGGAKGLLKDPARWGEMKLWKATAAEAYKLMRAGRPFIPPPDLIIEPDEYHPTALALAPWVTGGAFESHPIPAALLHDHPRHNDIHHDYFQARADRGDPDSVICSETEWGLADESNITQTRLSFHHTSFWEGKADHLDTTHLEAAEAALDAEISRGDTYITDAGDIPYFPLRVIPKGVVPQDRKYRVVTDHSHPKSSISTNSESDIDSLPDIRLSSAVGFGAQAGIIQSLGAGVYGIQRDAVRAYRQVAVRPCDLWRCGTAHASGIIIDARLSFGVRMAVNKFQRLISVPMRHAMADIRAFDAAHPPTDPELAAVLAERVARLGPRGARLCAATQYIDDGLAVSTADPVTAHLRTPCIFAIGPSTNPGNPIPEDGHIRQWEPTPTTAPRGRHHAAIIDATLFAAGIEMAGMSKGGVPDPDSRKRVDSELGIQALGIDVDFRDCVLRYPPEKAPRLRARIDAAIADAHTGSIERADVSALIGKEKWVAHVALSLNPLLASGYGMAACAGRRRGAASRRDRVAPSSNFIADQTRIRAALEHLPTVPLVPLSNFPPLSEPGSSVVFQDASSTFGMGGFFVTRDAVHYVQEEWPKEVIEALAANPRRWTIAAAELWAELVLLRLAHLRGVRGHITDFTDNEAARAAANLGGSRAPQLQPIAAAIAACASDPSFALRTLRVTTHENGIADDISRADLRSVTALATSLGLPLLRASAAEIPGIWDLVILGAHPSIPHPTTEPPQASTS